MHFSFEGGRPGLCIPETGLIPALTAGRNGTAVMQKRDGKWIVPLLDKYYTA